GGDIITREKYQNFELSLEWKVSEGGNSGIFYLAREKCGNDSVPEQPIYKSAPEMQILDNERHPDAKLGEDGNRQAGALYDLIPAKPQNANPAGEWNKVLITVYKGTVIHNQNGENVVEYHLWTDDWEAMCADSKFSEWEDFINTAKKGYIGLQDHGDDVWFRNIKIREL
ncbi:MAG: 3-keto-disaccharide hydrolase, partial [Bacteroidales bacterium]